MSHRPRPEIGRSVLVLIAACALLGGESLGAAGNEPATPEDPAPESVGASPLRVRVVDEQGTPLSSIWVAILGERSEGRSVEWRWLREWLDRGAEGPPDPRPMWHATDAEGWVELHESASLWTDLLAVGAKQGGRSIVPRGGRREVVVVARPHRYWSVQVVDPQDPAARPRLPVRLQLAHSRGYGAIRDEIWPAGEDHVARFGPVDLLVDPADHGPILEAELQLPALVRPRIRRAVAEVSDEIDRLVLPPHGSLQFEVAVEEGEAADGAFVSIVCLGFDQFPGLGWVHLQDLLVNEGAARVDWVGLGAELRLSGYRSRYAPGEGEEWDRTSLGEPRLQRCAELQHPAELQRIEMVVSSPVHRRVVVHGRALDADGALLRRRALGVILCDAHDGFRVEEARDGSRTFRIGERIETDAQGRFEGTFHLYEEMPKECQLIVTDRGPREEDVEVLGASDARAVDPTRWLGGDLGEVVLRPAPILYRGRVLDLQGRPVQRVFVEPYAGSPEETGDSGGPGSPDPASTWWRGIDHWGTFTDSGGRFALRGWTEPRGPELRARHDIAERSLPRPPVGAEELVFRLDLDRNHREELAGRVVGTLLLDAEVPREAVNVTLHRSEDRWRLDGWGATGAGDRFGTTQAPPGLWELRVEVENFADGSALVHRVPEVEVRAGELTEIAPIDLRGEIEVARLQFRDVEGRPVPFGHVTAPSSASESGGVPYTLFQDAELVLCGIGKGLELDVLGKGCRMRRIRVHPGSSIQELPPALKLKLRLAGDAKPRPGLGFSVWLHRESDSAGLDQLMLLDRRPDHRAANFDITGVCQLSVPMAGVWTLGVECSRRKPRSSVTLLEMEVELVDLDVMQTLDLVLEPDWEKALRR